MINERAIIVVVIVVDASMVVAVPRGISFQKADSLLSVGGEILLLLMSSLVLVCWEGNVRGGGREMERTWGSRRHTAIVGRNAGPKSGIARH